MADNDLKKGYNAGADFEQAASDVDLVEKYRGTLVKAVLDGLNAATRSVEKTKEAVFERKALLKAQAAQLIARGD